MNSPMPAESEPFLRTRKSTTGCVLRGDSCQATKAASVMAERTERRTMEALLNQSSCSPSSRTYCREARPVAISPIPAQSTGSSRRAGSVSCSRKKTSPPARRPIGTLMKKHQFQFAASVIQPPKVGPKVGKTTSPIRKTGWTTACSLGEKTWTKVACAVEIRAAPPAPCKMRQTISPPRLCDVPQKNEATVNKTIEPTR